jgi:hypothetical protein
VPPNGRKGGPQKLMKQTKTPTKCINEAKNCLFKRTNKIDKPLAKLKDEKGDIKTDISMKFR